MYSQQEFFEELKFYYDMEVLWLVRYGNMAIEDAHHRILQLPPFSEPFKGETYDLEFRESPYYWAMSLIKGQTDPPWFTDPNLWPIPENYQKLEDEYVEWRDEMKQNHPFFFQVLMERFIPLVEEKNKPT